MKNVWPVLLRAKKAKPESADQEATLASADREAPLASADRLDRMQTWGVSEERLSRSEIAAAAFFAFCVRELSIPRPAWTRSQAQNWATETWQPAADLCAWIASDPMFDSEFEFRKAAAIMSAGLAKHAKILKERGRLIELGQADEAYIVGNRSSGTRGDDQTRMHVRTLATQARKLFGSFLYGSIAK
jgi:hypothetical protein